MTSKRPRHLVLGAIFFEHVQSILDRADDALAAGEDVDVDEVAQLIASQVRPSLLYQYPVDAAASADRPELYRAVDRRCEVPAHEPEREGSSPSPAPLLFPVPLQRGAVGES